MAQLNLDLNGTEAKEGYDEFKPRTPGWYPLIIVDTEITQKEGKAPCLKITFEFEDGNPGRVWEYCSFSEAAMEITKTKLRTIAEFGGHKNPSYIPDSEELHGIRLLGRLEIDNEKYNKIKGYKPSGAKVEQPVQAATKTTNTPSSGTPTMPWQTK